LLRLFYLRCGVWGLGVGVWELRCGGSCLEVVSYFVAGVVVSDVWCLRCSCFAAYALCVHVCEVLLICVVSLLVCRCEWYV
jgi:hypothetical protein